MAIKRNKKIFKLIYAPRNLRKKERNLIALTVDHQSYEPLGKHKFEKFVTLIKSNCKIG